MKHGLKTTEFWITFLTIIASSAASFERILDPKYAAILSTISSIAYLIARTLLKDTRE